MSISQFLTKLDELHIQIDVVDDKLKVQAPEGKLTPSLISELKEKKQGIIEFFQKNVQKQKYVSIPPAIEKDYYELSSAQMRMYFLQQMNLNSTVYNITEFKKLGKNLNKEADTGIDVNRLESTFKRLIERHESLRTSFYIAADKPVQKIHREVDFKIEYYNKVDDFVRPFDLSQTPLLRVGIIETGIGELILGIDMHHIICDGTSINILVREFTYMYSYAQGYNHGLPKLRIQYKDYAEWQNSEEQREARKKQEGYWLKELAGEIPVLELPTDFPRPHIQSLEGSRRFFKIPAEKSQALMNMAVENGVTLYTMLLSLLYILMTKLSGQDDIIIGTPTAGRRHADLEGIIGMFVNTLALRNYPSREKTFKAFLQEVNQRSLEAFENQDYQFEDLVEKLSVRRDVARNPLFDVMFAWQDIDSNVNTRASSAENETHRTGAGASNYTKPLSRFDITWNGVGSKNYLFFALEYCTKLFKEETILKFIEFFKIIVSSIIENKDKKIAQIEIITEEEKNRILYDFNDSEMTYPKEKTIHQLFEEQVAKIPDNIAVAGPSLIANHESFLHITYRELNKKSNLLAQVLQHNGRNSETPPFVGIMMKPSTEMITGIIGILKFGGAYLPIDPEYPQERIDYMLKDSGAKILLTDYEKKKMANCQLSIVNCELLMTEPGEPFHHSSFINHSSHLAYLIYTSGSTGRPKGAMIEHTSVVNLLFSLQKEYPLGVSDTYLLKTSYIFDVSVTELFGWYLGGGKVVILEKGGEKDPRVILNSIERNFINYINFVPSMFNAFLEHLTKENRKQLASLRYVFLAGEVLLPGYLEKLRGFSIGAELENLYGPTEATVYSSKYSISGWDWTGSIPIGKPIRNLNLFILDKYNRVQPLGIPGELCIAGRGVARGYLNRPELTAEKFISSPLTRHLSRLYKTGDLARWLTDGNIEFLGRTDHQVKIRGFRIELQEIENQLLTYENIKEAVVLKKGEDSNAFLCAYIVSDTAIEKSALSAYLTGRLPIYMVPHHFVSIDRIPLTPSGKVDRKSLPDPKLSEPAHQYLAPRDEIEERTTQLCIEVLGKQEKKLSINSNFFEIGGNSLKLMILNSKIHRELGIEIPINQLFNNPTIMGVSDSIRAKNFIEKPVALLNRAAKNNIFCFPPQIGYGVYYTGLASFFNDYSFYALSFIETDDRIDRYVDLITDIQPDSPYIMFGHSIAGLLCFEVTKALEDRGYEVSTVIFADCYYVEDRKTYYKGFDKDRYKALLSKEIDEYLEKVGAAFLRERILKKSGKYLEYYLGLEKLEVINANVHLITSGEDTDNWNPGRDINCWRKITNRDYRVHRGYGRHQAMLDPGAVEKNARIIRKILDDRENEECS
ncbi:MAG: hypothetical protein QG657_964 [Acidobacteriota bacterium]|nr:hypothetical protein [Acidobacteriota bacterium]